MKEKYLTSAYVTNASLPADLITIAGNKPYNIRCKIYPYNPFVMEPFHVK